MDVQKLLVSVKSNILEALGLLSWYYYRNSLKEYVRFQGIQNLFYDDLLEQPVEIKSDKFIINIKFKDDIFNFEITDLIDGEISNKSTICSLNYNGDDLTGGLVPNETEFIKFYRFLRQNQFPDKKSSPEYPKSLILLDTYSTGQCFSGDQKNTIV